MRGRGKLRGVILSMNDRGRREAGVKNPAGGMRQKRTTSPAVFVTEETEGGHGGRGVLNDISFLPSSSFL